MAKIWLFIVSHKGRLAAYLVAALLFSIYQFFPVINQFISFGIMMIVPTMLVFAVVPWVVAVVLCVAIAIIYWLAGIRNSVASATVAFSVSYLLISLLIARFDTSGLVRGGVIVLACLLFMGLTWAVSRVRWSRAILLVGLLLLGLSLYFTPRFTQSIDAQQYEAKTEDAFQRAVNTLTFTPYYPTYSSPAYPMTIAKLNGYQEGAYTNETVAFQIGKAKVKESALLKDQDQIMNFVDNCNTRPLWYAMTNSDFISQQEIDRSRERLQKCEVVHTTPDGNKVYMDVSANKDYIRFYVKLDKTNFLMEFDNSLGKGYDSNKRDELMKVIDSLRPLDTSKLERGTAYGSGE